MLIFFCCFWSILDCHCHGNHTWMNSRGWEWFNTTFAMIWWNDSFEAILLTDSTFAVSLFSKACTSDPKYFSHIKLAWIYQEKCKEVFIPRTYHTSYKNDPFSSVFDLFLDGVAMGTNDTNKTTHKWILTVESIHLIPHLPWSDTDLKKWHIMQINIQKGPKLPKMQMRRLKTNNSAWYLSFSDSAPSD